MLPSRTVGLRWVTVRLVAYGALTVFFPFFWMAITSLKTAPAIHRVPLQILPDHWTNLSNYREVFQREPFGRYLFNSALVASTAALSSLVVFSLAGYGFAKFRFSARDVFFFSIIWDPQRFTRQPSQQVLASTLVVRRTCGALAAPAPSVQSRPLDSRQGTWGTTP